MFLVDFMLGELSPINELYWQGRKVRCHMGNRVSKPDFSNLLECVSILVRSCHTQSSTEDK